MFRCAICQENLSHDQVSAVKCGHTFHFHCLCRWLQQSKSCPTCRIAINSVNTDVITHVYLEFQSLNSFLETSMSDDYEKKCVALESSLNQANDQILSKDKLIYDIRAVLERTEIEKRDLERKSASQIKTISVLRSKCQAFDALQVENDHLSKQNSSMKKKMDTLNKLNSLLNGSSEEAQNCLDDLSIESFEQTKLLLSVLKDRLREASNRNEKMEYDLRRLRAKLSSFENNEKKVKELQEKLLNLESDSNQNRMKKALDKKFSVDNSRKNGDCCHVSQKLVTCKTGKRLKTTATAKPKTSDESSSNDENDLPERSIDIPSEDDDILGLANGGGRASKKPPVAIKNSKPATSKFTTGTVFLNKPDGLGGRSRDLNLHSAGVRKHSSTSSTSTFKRTPFSNSNRRAKKLPANKDTKKITAFSSKHTKPNLSIDEILISD